MENKAVSSRNFFYSLNLVAGFVVLLPLLVKQTYRMADSFMWWFAPFALLSFLYLVLRTKYVGVAAHPIRRWSSVGLMVAGAFTGLIATIAESPDVAHLALLLLLTGWAMIRQGIVPWTRVLACCAVMWIAWPLPYGLTERVAGKLHREAITTARGVLDEAGVKNLTTSTSLDLRTTRLDLTKILDHAGSLPALLFVTVMILLSTRHPLLLSLLAILSAVVYSWFGDVLLVLLQVWAVQNSVSNWDAGWPLFATQVTIFMFELVLVAITLYSLSYLFEAVPVDSAQKADKGWHGLYNRIVVWPLNFVAIHEDEGPAYLEEEDHDVDAAPKKDQAIKARNTPSFSATRAATDPFLAQPRVLYSTLGCLALTGVLAVLCWLIPQRDVDLGSLAKSATQMENVAGAPNDIAGMVLIAQVPIDNEDENTRAVGWNYALPSGLATLTLEYPRIGSSTSPSLEGWSQVGIPHMYKIDGWEVLETEFVNSIGNRAYTWLSAINRKGGNYSQGGVIGRSINRLKRSILGRAIGLSVDEVTYHSRLLVQPPNSIAMQRREEVRAAFVSANKTIAQSLSNQGKN